LQIAEGDRVILQLASANRDPQQFPSPDRFEFARRGAAQLSLGFGPHACVGAALIRTTITAATKAFVEKFGDVEICGPVEWRSGCGFRSLATLRVRNRGENRDNSFTSSSQPRSHDLISFYQRFE
jgi:cytochrome P450